MYGIKTDTSITVYTDAGKTYTIASDHPNFMKVKEAMDAKRFKDVEKLIHIPTFLESFSGGDFKVKDGILYYQDEPYPQIVVKKVMAMLEQGYPIKPLQKFLAKTKQNPDPYARVWVLEFATRNQFQIDEDGDLIAYKGVRDNFTDAHTGKLNNSVGKTVRMNRSEVEVNKDIACAPGLHVSTLTFANSYGKRTIVVKQNPRDICSVPRDGNGDKVRSCEYKVIAEIPRHGSDQYNHGRAQPVPRREVYRREDFVNREFPVSIGEIGEERIVLISAVDVNHAEDIVKERFGANIRYAIFDLENIPGVGDYKVTVDKGAIGGSIVEYTIRAWDVESAALIALEKCPFAALRENVTVEAIVVPGSVPVVEPQAHSEEEDEEWDEDYEEDWDEDDDEEDEDEEDGFDEIVAQGVARVVNQVVSHVEAALETQTEVTTAPADTEIDKRPFKQVRTALRALGRKLGMPLFQEGMDKNDMLKVYHKYENEEPNATDD